MVKYPIVDGSSRQPTKDDPIVKQSAGNWHKICAIMIWKYHLDVSITTEDLCRWGREEKETSVFLDAREKDLKVKLYRPGDKI